MRLSELLKHIDVEGRATADVGDDPDICSLHYRAQEVIPGGLFVAIRGQAADGHDYIEEALSRGAAAVVAQRRTSDDGRIIRVPDSRKALAQLAAAFFGDPSKHLTLVGVTGTNGKTTVTYLVEGMLTAAGLSAGVIGTNNCRYAGRVFDSSVTTPESLDLQRILAGMRDEGVSHVVMEVSSHGIDLGRVSACRFDVGAFTNLTQDHLDYHETMEAYWDCKRRFFIGHLPSGPKAAQAVAVVNMDNERGRELRKALAACDPAPTVVAYGRDNANDVYTQGISIDLSGIRGSVVTPRGALTFRSRLVGEHNLENILCAAAIAEALTLPLSAVQAGIDAMDRVPGRLERVDDRLGRMVFVDYAHTPDALENVLGTLQRIARRRIVCVFGCGGDRDRGKRPIMGKIAGKRCDLAVVTSDNPRTEVPERIIEEIVSGVRTEMPREIRPEDPAGWTGERAFMVIPDRASAIRRAIREAGAGDVVLIAGKGHETYQIIGKEKRDFDDRKVAAKSLGETGNNGTSWTGADILAATGGRLVHGEFSDRFSGVGIDSRTLEAAALYVAIVGKTHDGHGFCRQVVDAGGRGVLVNENALGNLPIDAWRKKPVFCGAVPDTTRALGDMAAFHRARHSAKVAAITGSCGKTTTRDMTASVLRQRYRTLSSRKNFNNEIGLPLTLLSLEAIHEWVVAELGMNHPGEIARLGEICHPDIGVITNVGAAHLEGLGTVENVAAAKGELLPAIKTGGIAVLNADDHRVKRLQIPEAAGRVLFFGESDSADIRGRKIVPSAAGTMFELVLPECAIQVSLKVPGVFMVSNALAAAAVGYAAELSPEEIKAGLEAFESVPGRMNLIETVSGVHILDDTYNANPVSMAAAVSTLTAVRGEGRGIVVLGDMFELGERSEEFHHALGVVAAQSGVVRVYAAGRFAETVAAGAREAFMSPQDMVAGSQADILADLKKQARPGDWVLVKGSRAAGMEKIVAELVTWAGGIKQE